MKINSTPVTVIAIFLFAGLVFFYGCKKEDPLKPNPDMEIYQTEDFAGGINFGDTTGNGGGTGGNGGGGSTVSEYFTVDIDGVNRSYDNPVFQSLMAEQIISDPLSSNNQIQITRFSGFSVDTFDNPTIGLFRGQTAYQSIDGQLIIDSLTADFIKGKFYCNVVMTTGSDTISLTNGLFKVAK